MPVSFFSAGIYGLEVGRTPRSARVPLDPLFRYDGQADEGVGCGPGGPPHVAVTHSDGILRRVVNPLNP